jgi:hypothetical protein
MAGDIVTQEQAIVPRLMQGAVELHCHVDPEFQGGYRSVNALELARELRGFGMRAAVVKSISLPSTGHAYIVNQAEPGFSLCGSIVLNNCVGGLNPDAVAAALRQGDGARIVWMPSVDARQHIEFFHARGHVSAFYHTTPRERAITILDGPKVKPEVREIVRLVATHQRCLATGHLAPEESLRLVETAREEGVERIIVTHPTWAVVNMSEEIMGHLVKMGAYLEHCYAMCAPHMWAFHKIEPTRMDLYARLIKTFGAEHTVISTDTGNYDLPRPGEAMRVYLACLLEHGVTEAELDTMVKKNAYFLLGLS